ncbi:MAG: hypothetical protein B6I26_02785 [Desulfobacteraceae bacterium 4572_130]|nr:MAG: hypothetical protein B6I26_02785 [Desulfobacteraceae bacterium 4572_130]
MVDKISYARKKELEHPDPFLEFLHKALEHVKYYKKQLIYMLCGVLTVVLIFIGTVYSIKSAEKNSSDILARTLSKYRDKKSGERYDFIKDDFIMLLNKYPRTSVAKIARLKFAEICYQTSNFDKAYEMYLAGLKDFKDNLLLKNFMLVCLGNTCQAQKKNEKAEEYFKQVINAKNSFLKDEALFNLGMMAKNKDISKKFFGKIISDYGNSLYKPMVIDKIKDYDGTLKKS